MKKPLFIATNVLFVCFAPFACCEAKFIDVFITCEWTCPACRHGNPDSVNDCEYCGKSR